MLCFTPTTCGCIAGIRRTPSSAHPRSESAARGNTLCGGRSPDTALRRRRRREGGREGRVGAVSGKGKRGGSTHMQRDVLSVLARAAFLAALSTVAIFFASSFRTCVIRCLTACVYVHVLQKKRVVADDSHSSSVPSFGQNKSILRPRCGRRRQCVRTLADFLFYRLQQMTGIFAIFCDYILHLFTEL